MVQSGEAEAVAVRSSRLFTASGVAAAVCCTWGTLPRVQQ